MSDLIITITPSTGSSVVSDGGKVRSIKAVAFVTLAGDDGRRTFTRPAQQGINGGRPATYRLAQFTVYEDGSVWAWAAQMTKAGQPYKSGMGVTLGGLDDMARIYGQDVRDVVDEALAKIETERKLDELAARGQEILDTKGQTVDEYWAERKATAERVQARTEELIQAASAPTTCSECTKPATDCECWSGPTTVVPTALPEGAILAGRHLIGTAAGLTMRETNTLEDALDVFAANPVLARVLAGILLAE